MSTSIAMDEQPTPIQDADTVELHVRNVPRSVWLQARQSALASRLRFGQYIIELLKKATPLPVSPRVIQELCPHCTPALPEKPPASVQAS